MTIIYADFRRANYDWKNMENDYPTDATKKLIYHCGVSVDMRYGTSGSGINNPWIIDNALRDYFGFKSSTDFKWRSLTWGWAKKLRNELNNGRPVIYNAGYIHNANDKDWFGGHTFVLDGYNGSDHFHINWGWYGDQNGRYYLGDFDTDYGNFNQMESAIFGAEPKRETGVGKPNIIYPNAFEGNSVVLHTRPVEGATDYEWTSYPLTTSTITGTGRTVVLTASGSCQVCVRAHNAQCDIYSNQYCEYIVKGAPNNNNYFIHGPSVVKIRQEANYWTDPVPGTSSYEWSVREGLFLDKDKPIQYYIAGNGTNATFWTSKEGCYTINVKAVNEFGSSWQSKQISTSNSNCNSGKSDTTKFTRNNKIISSTAMNINNKTSEITNNIQSIKEITIFPNPASNYIYITIPENNKKLMVKIVNMQGKIMKTLETEKHIFRIYTKDIDNGFYILQIIDSEKIINKKIQIIK